MGGRHREKRERKKWLYLRNARRISQAAFLLVFLWLIALTAAVTGGAFDASTTETMPYPVELFLNLDPLAGAIVLLATGTIPAAMLLGLTVLGLGFLFGRAFCGWACPMGTINHIASEWSSKLRGKRRLEANRTRPYQKVKYAILAAVLFAALFGSAVGGLLDPLCLATRGIALVVLPWIQWSVNLVLGRAMESNSATWQHAADGAYEALGGVLLYQRGLIVAGGFLVALIFVAVVVANRWIPRFWCRGLCPLGALLGLSGRFGILSMQKDENACKKCFKCELHCSQAASPKPGDRWQRSECDLCMNCVADCPHDACAFALYNRPTNEQPVLNFKRRTLIAGGAAGALLVPAMRTGGLKSQSGRPHPDCIRPPGALDEAAFLDRCIRCGQCMKICPNNALQPALHEGGVEGLWTPILVPQVGYCEPTCTLCTNVCPTGAIRQVSAKQKTGEGGAEMVRLGTAFISRGRCLPWATGTPCIVCEEFCPQSPKAIWFSVDEVSVRGQQVTLKRPHVDPSRCNGCGACEHICPVHDRAAIRVSSAGESRAPSSALLLTRTSRGGEN